MKYILYILLFIVANTAFAQKDSSLFERNKTITAYPNPVSNQLNLEGSYMAISLFNSDGKRINVAIQSTNGALTIDISHLANGVYFLKCTDEFNTQTIKKVIFNNNEQK